MNNAPQALIIEPSRELAEQTLVQIQKFKAHLGAPMVKVRVNQLFYGRLTNLSKIVVFYQFENIDNLAIFEQPHLILKL